MVTNQNRNDMKKGRHPVASSDPLGHPGPDSLRINGKIQQKIRKNGKTMKENIKVFSL